jgi:hypothetical protein
VVIGGKGNASAVLPSSREAVQDGNAQKITFSFSQAGDVSLRAFVVPAESYFTKWGPSNIPSPSATASPAASKPGSPKPSRSVQGSPAAGAERSPSATASKSPSH